MTEYEPQQPTYSRSAPPTVSPGIKTPKNPSTWPTVIGVLAIVFGAGGALLGAWTAVSPLFVKSMRSVMPAEQAPMLEVTERWSAYTVVAGLFSTAIAVLLIVAGVGLLRRRPWSAALAKTWAVIKILLVVVTSTVGYKVQQETFESMNAASAGGATPGLPQGFAEILTALTLIIGLLWGWAMPVFVLIWFARAKIKQEVAAWG